MAFSRHYAYSPLRHYADKRCALVPLRHYATLRRRRYAIISDYLIVWQEVRKQVERVRRVRRQEALPPRRFV